MNKVLPYGVVLGLFLIFGLLGWRHAGIETLSINAHQGAWHTPQAPSLEDGAIETLRQRLLDSGYFRNPKVEAENTETHEDVDDDAMSAVEKQYGRFPYIISIARIDGEDTAQLRGTDNAVLTVRAGDVLDGGWVVTRIFSSYLEADAGSERFSFAVFEHKSIQEQDEIEE